MRKDIGIVYMSVIAVFLLMFLFFDVKVKDEDKKAGESMKMANINMVSNEVKEDITRCDEASAAGKQAVISIKEIKRFLDSADRSYKFGASAHEKMISIRTKLADSTLITSSETAAISASGLAAAEDILKDMQDLLQKASDQGYDFDF